MDRSILSEPVEGFIEELTPELRRVAGRLDGIDASHAGDDVTVEAFDLCAAFVDVDGYHSDTELWELIVTFGPRLRSLLGLARPDDVRHAGVVSGRSRWLEQPSSLFEILRADDLRTGGRAAWRYYERAMAVAHTIAELEGSPNPVMLRALDHFRAMLVDSIRGHPQQPPATPPGTAPAPSPDGVPAAGPAPAGAPAAGTPPAGTEPPGTGAGGAAPAGTAPGSAGAPASAPAPRSVEEVLADLDGLVGLAPV